MKILIKGNNWIGDAVMSIPAMMMLRDAFPDASIALHTRAWAKDVFIDAAFIDHLIPFDPSASKMRTVMRESRSLRRETFDAAVIFPNSFESALTVALAGIPRRFGYRNDGRQILLSEALPVPPWKNERHESEFYKHLVRFVIGELGGVSDSTEQLPTLAVSAERRFAAKGLLGLNGAEASSPLIAIGPGSTNSNAKRWPAEYFGELCNSFSSDLGARIVMLGSRGETEMGEAVKQHCDCQITDLMGKTDLALASAILAESDLFVSNDMGLAHISAALGTPTLTLFGPTNEVTTSPLGPRARFVREVVECSPCMLRVCPIDHRCMIRLGPERVFEVAARMLDSA